MGNIEIGNVMSTASKKVDTAFQINADVAKLYDEAAKRQDRAWGKIASDLNLGADITELQNSEEFNWELQMRPVHDPEGDVDPDRFLLQRRMPEGTKHNFGVVSEKYVMCQNYDALESVRPFFDSGAARFESGGSMNNGESNWLMARMATDKPIMALPEDPILPYLTMLWSHNGRGALKVFFTATRLGCMNQMGFMNKQADQRGVIIRHRSGMENGLKMVMEVIKRAYTGMEQTEELLKRLTSSPVNQKSLDKFFREVLRLPTETELDKIGRNLDALFTAYEEERNTMPLAGQDTLNHAYNAVTRWSTHNRQCHNDELKWWHTMFGQEKQLRIHALEVAEKMALAA